MGEWNIEKIWRKEGGEQNGGLPVGKGAEIFFLTCANFSESVRRWSNCDNGRSGFRPMLFHPIEGGMKT